MEAVNGHGQSTGASGHTFRRIIGDPEHGGDGYDEDDIVQVELGRVPP